MATFTRHERLKSRKVISRLFQEGQSFAQYPLRFVWLVTPPVENVPPGSPLQFTVSVPKKRFKHAVDRNRLRRQIREAYRLHKEKLYAALPDTGNAISLMVIYTGAEALPYTIIAEAMYQALGRLSRKMLPRTDSPSAQENNVSK
ncbi:MAG: ribonuclease P protein component [Lewinellaceae bacterium]|nr:ribonuclease P protein component [Lewinellaceae bacterium]